MHCIRRDAVDVRGRRQVVLPVMGVLEHDAMKDVLACEGGDLDDLADGGAVAGHDRLTGLDRGPRDEFFSHGTHDKGAELWDRCRVPAEIVTIETPELGDRSYVVLAGDRALVVDPQRDIDRVMEVLAGRGSTLSHVLETHIHNDYVSGGPELCRLTGATHVIPAREPVAYARQAIGDGESIAAGGVTIRARHTPGHTATHMTYLLEEGGRPVAAFTGGSMLLGSVGRTDLAGPWATDHLSHLQHRSARTLSTELPDDAAILPTHGFGSLCSATFPGGAGHGADARHQRSENPALLMDEDAFVTRLISGLDAFPRYYAYIAPRNRAGAGAVDAALPPRSEARELVARARAGEWVIDLRERSAFAARHLAGTLAFELSDPLATYLGWLLPWGSPLSLIGSTTADLASAQRALARIGIETVAAYGLAEVEEGGGDPWAGLPTASHPLVKFSELVGSIGAPGEEVVDVRLRGEWSNGHLPGARHIPLHELPDRIDEVPPGKVWVHCAAGYRASVAGSLLARAGRDVMVVSDPIENAVACGIELVAD
jgi:hydroxyacylglutathione hydrolase